MGAPLPWMYEHKEEFFALPFAERPPHILEALLYSDWAADQPGADLDAVKQQMEVLSGIAREVAMSIADELQQQEAWRDPYDPRWPRFHPDSTDPLYVTGCHPPLLLCLAGDDDAAWKEVEFDVSQKEATEWMRTPAGSYGTPPDWRRETEAASASYDDTVEKVREAEAKVKRARAAVDAARAKLMETERRANLRPQTPPPKKKLD